MRNPKIIPLLLLVAAGPVFGQPADEVALMRQVFAQLQPLSFREAREFCGYIGLDADGRLTATPATRGETDGCLAADPDDLAVIYASYHTHGAFEGDEGHEVPSVEDMEGDADEGIDGYVATPGGRLWYIDTEDMITFQVCGRGCLPQDPGFRPFAPGVVADSYAYDDLVEFLE